MGAPSPRPLPANKREELHYILVDVLGSEHVYFQPPASVSIVYPCIVYKRDKLGAIYAGNKKYNDSTRYQITVIDPDPDSPVVKAIFALSKCAHLRTFVADGLNHDIFELYY